MNRGILLILLGERFAAAHKLFARISRNARIDHIEGSAKPGGVGWISAGQIEDQICFEEQGKIGILLGGSEPRRVDNHFVVTALEIAETKAPASIRSHLIDHTTAESLQPHRNITRGIIGASNINLAGYFEWLIAGIVRIAIALSANRGSPERKKLNRDETKRDAPHRKWTSKKWKPN